MSVWRAAAVIVAYCGVVGGVFASPLPTGGPTAEEVAKVMRAKGLPTTISIDEYGDPQIDTASNGAKWMVRFYHCKNDRCPSMQFNAGWNLTNGMALPTANRWNKEWRFGTVFVDDQGDPYIKYDMDVERGITTEAIDNNLDRWFQTLKDWQKFMVNPVATTYQ